MQERVEKKSIKNLDFNCDLAQSYGVYKNNNEFELLDYVSSVNISCGFHAGDPVTIKDALLKAKEKNITDTTERIKEAVEACGKLKQDNYSVIAIRVL